MISRAKLEQAVQAGLGEKPLAEILPDHSHQAPLTALNFPHVHDDHPLDMVLRRMADTGLNVLPVVSRSNLRGMKGIVSLKDVLNAYGLGEQPRRTVPAPEKETASPFPLLAGISAVLLALFLLTGFFIYYYRVERQSAAEDAFQKGNTLVKQGRYEEAIEQYRSALSVSHKPGHRLALAMTLEKADRMNDAGIYLQELVQEDPNSGLVNLGLARIAARQERVQEATTFYHRAIYGHWSKVSEENPIQVRFELIKLLSTTGSRKQALSELMALSEEIRDDTATTKRVGRMLLEFGAAKESSEIFRSILRREPRDVEAYAGLGEAEFAQRDYLSAREAFRNALRLKPNEETIQRRLELCDNIVSMDPTLPRLNSAEQYRRSRRLLENCLRVVEECLATHSTDPPGDVRDSMAQTRRNLLLHGRPSHYIEEAEANVELAKRLWQARTRLCSSSSFADEALSLVLPRLSF